MKLGEVARVARGVVTGNRSLFVMSRAKAREYDLEVFVKPIMGGMRDIPKEMAGVARDGPDREVILIASRRDVERSDALKAYLGNEIPRVATVRVAPIAATYVGVPRFVANPDGLVVTNSLYCVTPRQNMDFADVLELVKRLNTNAAGWPRARYAERLSPRQMEALEV